MVEWFAVNASVSRVGEQMGCLFHLPRDSLERAGVSPPSQGPAEGSAEGSRVRQTGLPSEGRSLPSSEAEMECAAGGLGREASSEEEVVSRVRGGPQMGRTTELGRMLSED